jgi:uncharacterized protein (TIGR02246 family)
MRRVVVFLCAVAVVGVWTRAAGQMGGDAKAGVVKVRDSYAKAVNAGDAKGVAMLYAADGVEMPPNQPSVKGRAAIEAYHQKLNSMMGAAITITATETIVQGDVAVDVGTYRQTLTPKAAGAKPFQDTGKYIVVLERTGGAWHVSHTIYNSDLPPNPAMAAGMK